MTERGPFPGRPESVTAVILAAGEGSRLRTDQTAVPKPLVELRGMSIAERSVTQLLRGGVSRFVVVLGCDASLVRREFVQVGERHGCTVLTVVAPDWERGNGCSAAAAEALVGDQSFVLTMVDHLLDAEMIRAILTEPLGPRDVARAVDHDVHSVLEPPDLTKEQVSDGWVTAIGKGLETWNAGDTGLFLCSPRLFAGLAKARRRGEFSLSAGMQQCMADGGVRAVDVTGRP